MPAATDNLDDGADLRTLMRGFWPLILESAFDDADLIAFDLANPYVQDALDELAKLVIGIADTTKDEIRALVGRQAAEGWSIDRLADELETLGEVRSRERALTIARTETARGYSLGSLAAYQISGVVDRIEWMTAADERTCPICAPLNGTTAAMGNTFEGGIGFPPAHPNCRCAIAPVITG
jgi:SPP1 gp7 family putative phage head morphogenesis protein